MIKNKTKNLVGVLCIIAILFQIIIIFFSVIVSLPPNPLSLNKNKTELIQGFIPQGWGFYSKDPTEAELNVYTMEADYKLIWPNNRIKNIFGLYRYGRAQGTEIGLLQSEIPYESWSDKMYEIANNKENSSRAESILDKISEENPEYFVELEEAEIISYFC